MATILVADDETNIRRMLRSLLGGEEHLVREADSGAAAVAVIADAEPDAALLDLYMPDGNALEVLPQIRRTAPELPVIVMSGRATLSDAVRATKLGAFHFIEKPLTPEAVLLTIRSALELRRTRELNRALRAELDRQSAAELVGRSAAMEQVRDLIARVAPTEGRVLITGESGTGKELAAAAIHRESSRADGPMIRVNCAAIPRELVESELFGHERGAFTGATERRRGRFEVADEGTLFLDEVGDLHTEAQAKLLRVLEAGEVERVGGTQLLHVNVRVVAATNKDLRAEVAAGRFREDLLFRLLVLPVHMPALRERLDDIPLLVEHFLRRYAARGGHGFPRLTSGAYEALCAHTWPGNVRELANIVERLSVLHSEQDVGAAEIRALLFGSGSGARGSHPHAYRDDDERPFSQRLEDFERDLIRGALRAGNGSVAEAARRLGTDRPNLYRRLRRLEIEY